MTYVEVARSESTRGELVLRERRAQDGGPTSVELRANGIFVMDSVEVRTGRAVASTALALVADPRWVLIGGLRPGFTMHEVLAEPRVQPCAVVEIEEALVIWSATEDPALAATLRRVFGNAQARPLEVLLQERDERYWLYVARA